MNILKNNFFKILLLIAAAAAVFLALYNYKETLAIINTAIDVMMPLLIGACIAFILNIPLRMFEDKLFSKSKNKKTRFAAFLQKIKRPVSLILSILFVASIILVFVSLIMPEILDSIINLAENLPNYMTTLRSLIEKIASDLNISSESLPSFDWQSLSKNILNYFKAGSSAVIEFTSGVVSAVFDFILAFVFAIYILASKEKLGAQIRRLFCATIGKNTTKRLFSLIYLSNSVFTKYVVGQCAEAIILGILCYIGMLIFKMPYALMVSSLISLTALIPIFGAFIGTGVGAFMILLISPPKALAFIAFILVLQQIETNLIYPKVVGKSVGLPGIWVLAAVTIGGGLFGLVGMLISVPTASVIYCLTGEFLRSKESAESENSTALKE